MDLSKKKAFVYDYGVFMPIAMRLAEDFGEVFYFVPWKGTYCTRDRFTIGEGVPGLTRVDSFEDYIDQADVFVFPDVGDGDKQVMLRGLGKRVFGTGYAELLEQDRMLFKGVLKKQKLPVGPYKTFKGTDALSDFLRKEPGTCYIKVSTFRGNCETARFDTYLAFIPTLDRWAKSLGAYRFQMEFIVDFPIEGQEGGSDFFLSNGEYLPIGTYGYEVKDHGYISKAMKMTDMPDAITYVNDRMAPVYREYGICGAASSEERITKELVPYFTDMCARFGSPPAELICRLYKNFSQIVWAVSGGEMITPEPVAEYAAEVMISCEAARDGWVPLDYPEKLRKNVLLRNLCCLDGQFFHIPQDSCTSLGAAVGYGKTREAAQEQALKFAGEFGHDFDFAVFDKVAEYLEEAKEYGLGEF
jgi:hypothetical protein